MEKKRNFILVISVNQLGVVEDRDALIELECKEDWMADFAPNVLCTEIIDETSDIGTNFRFPMRMRLFMGCIIA